MDSFAGVETKVCWTADSVHFQSVHETMSLSLRCCTKACSCDESTPIHWAWGLGEGPLMSMVQPWGCCTVNQKHAIEVWLCQSHDNAMHSDESLAARCPEISALEVVICPSWAMEMRARCPRSPHKRTVVDIHINSVLWLDCHREGWSCANVFLFFFQKYFPANHGTALNALYVIQFSHVFPVSKSKKYILCNVFHMYFCCADHFLRFLGACYLWCQVVASDFDPQGL